MTKGSLKRSTLGAPRSRFAAISEPIGVTEADVLVAANVSGLTIRNDAGIANISIHLTSALTQYALAIRGLDNATGETYNAAWRDDVSFWAKEGIQLFGITETGDISLEALRLIWNQVSDEDIRERLTSLSSLLPLLRDQNAKKTKIKRRSNIERVRLIADCRFSFVNIQSGGTRFSVRTKNSADRYGPAIDWCRSLFTAADRNANGRSPEIAALVAWSAKSNALAEVIRELGE